MPAPAPRPVFLDLALLRGLAALPEVLAALPVLANLPAGGGCAPCQAAARQQANGVWADLEAAPDAALAPLKRLLNADAVAFYVPGPAGPREVVR